MKTRLKYTALLLSASVLAPLSHAAIVLNVDLNTLNQVTISATPGLSSATLSGDDDIGVYLHNFYPVAGSFLIATLVSGNLTNFENPSDGTPSLFRGGAGSDTGLNVFSWSSDAAVSFTTGSLAFVGSATWTLSNAMYTDMLAGPTGGDLYFPADEIAVLGGATVIGQWSKSASVIPEPSTYIAIAGMFGLGAFIVIRRRKQGTATEEQA